MSDSGALADGANFGNYQILQKLGAGGMGEVYRARDLRLGREVAIKTISLSRCSEAGTLTRFEQEARSACALNHPNIVTIYEFGNVDGTHYIAMELVEGATVRELLSAGPLPSRKLLVLAAQIADALAKAHAAGIVHRDLKPDNLMVTNDGSVKVLDFGLAKLSAAASVPCPDNSTAVIPATQPGMVMGTVGYMSPEQTNGGAVDFRSDQFSLGSVLYEMATGRPAFAGKSNAEIMAAILRDHPPLLGSKTLQAPAPFFWIVERCLAKNPDKRYVSTRDLAHDLATVRDRLADAVIRQPEPRFSNLPVQRTAFIGRRREAEALSHLLEREEVRLVTLTGPGGIGKTRLALQVAESIGQHFSGGTHFVALSSVSESEMVAATMAQALGIRESGKQSLQESLDEYLGSLSLPSLLLLDNFEHLLAAAPLVSHLLSVGPKLKIVATSQAPLHVYGEHEFPVPPLALPEPNSAPSFEALSRLPAVELFVERARAVKPDFSLTRENAQSVAAICARLDGLPLGIELAAARIKLLSPAAMLARLESSLDLLTGGARDLPLRQQTLRGTVQWSYRLLNAGEQTLFRRLSVFVGGCTLDGVEAVCNTRGDIGVDVLEGMTSMVDKSLVQQVEQGDVETRFLMLSTIREFARECMTESGEEAATRRAHAAYYLVLAEEGAQDSVAHPEWHDRFELEHDNLRRALEYLIENGDVEWGFRLGAALFRFWDAHEHLAEGRQTLHRLLAMDGQTIHLKLRARLLFTAAVLAGEQGDYRSARELLEESLERCVEMEDRHGVAVALNALAVNARDRGDPGAASLLLGQCIEIWRDLGGPGDIARAVSNHANVIKLQGQYERASALYQECLELFRQAGDDSGVAWTMNYQGDVAREAGDLAAARRHYEQSLAGFRRLRDGWGIASVLSDLANLNCDLGQHGEAERLFGESIRVFQQLDHKRGVARVLECIAANAAAQSRSQQALRLAGAAAALRQRLGAPLVPGEQATLEKALEFARRSLPGPDALNAWMEGWALPVDQAVLEALGPDGRTTQENRASG